MPSRSRPADAGLPGGTRAVRFGDKVYTGAVLPWDRNGAIVAGDIARQAEAAFRNLDMLLASAGAGMGEVAMMNCYVDPAAAHELARVRQVRSRHLAPGSQAGMEVPMSLGEPGARLAVEAIAHIGAARQPIETRGGVGSGSADAAWADAVRVGETLYVTGRQGRGRTFPDQARSVYEALDGILRTAGVSWRDVVRVHQFAVRPDLSIDDIRAARAPYLRNEEFLSTSVVCHPAALDGIRPAWQLVVGIEAALGPKIYCRTPHAWANPGGLHVVKSAGTGYFQAQMSRDVAGRTLFPGDAAAQTEQICRNLTAMMEAAEIGWADIVHARIFCKQGKYLPAVRSVLDRWMGADDCARTELVADFFDPLALVEIEVTAA